VNGWRDLMKLTPEQNEFVRLKFEEVTQTTGSNMLHVLDCRAILNACTEKEFPRFVIKFDNVDPIIYVTNDYKESHISVDTFGQTAHMSIEEFKQFSENCQKIVEWLEEQE
jgi:hypothetical protein